MIITIMIFSHVFSSSPTRLSTVVPLFAPLLLPLPPSTTNARGRPGNACTNARQGFLSPSLSLVRDFFPRHCFLSGISFPITVAGAPSHSYPSQRSTRSSGFLSPLLLWFSSAHSLSFSLATLQNSTVQYCSSLSREESFHHECSVLCLLAEFFPLYSVLHCQVPSLDLSTGRRSRGTVIRNAVPDTLHNQEHVP